MKITIPYNLFIFIWCLAGVGILGFYILQDLYQGHFQLSFRTGTEIICFLFFLLYCVSYVKDRKRNKIKNYT